MSFNFGGWEKPIKIEAVIFGKEEKKPIEKKKRKNQKRKREIKKSSNELQSRLFCGSIELKFCLRILGSMFFILND